MSTRALLLNASFEPLCAISERRALVLVLAAKAEVVHATDAVYRSERIAVEVPSVIRLLTYVRVPHGVGMTLNRRSVFLRDGGRCQYCDRAAESIDHVVPRSRGGTHSWDNVVAACRSCNSRKRDRLLEETNFVLRSRPKEPPAHSLLLAGANHLFGDWERYFPRLDVAAAGLTA